MRLATVIALVCALCVFTAPTIHAVGFTQAITEVSGLQGEEGGFWDNDNDEPTVFSTAGALLLTNLYGSTDMDAGLVAEYLASLSNSDGGFAPVDTGAESSIDATFAALRAHQYLGVAVANPAGVLDYLHSLYDDEAKLFAGVAGGRGDFYSTALVYACLDILGESEQTFAKSLVPHIKAALEESLVPTSAGVFFNFDGSDVASMADIHAGVVLGSFVDFAFDSFKDGLVDAIAALQNGNPHAGRVGAFLTSAGPDGFATLTASRQAAHALALLGVDFEESIDLMSLVRACRSRLSGLEEAADAHAIIAHAGLFSAVFRTEVGFSSLNAAPFGESLVSGTQFKPFVAVLGGDGVHVAGLDAEMTVTLPNGALTVHELVWSPASAQYVCHDSIDTTGALGEALYEFSLSKFVPGIGQISWKGSEGSNIGYGLDIDANVAYASKAVDEGDIVGDGVTFEYTLRIYDVAETDIRTGDYVATFALVDASGVAVVSETVNGASVSADAPIVFAAGVSGVAVPSGALTATFAIASADGVEHTKTSMEYTFVSSLVASSISVNGAAASVASPDTEAHIGSSLTVTMEPGSMPDMDTVVGFAHSEAAEARVFVLHIVSEHGDVVSSTTGVASAGSSGNVVVTFEVAVPASLALVGSHKMAFVYVDAAGNTVHLDNYDAAAKSLWDDASPLSLNVPVHLEMVSAQGTPSGKDFSYGNVIAFSFEIVDTVSGVALEAGLGAPHVDGTPAAGVYLVISHKDAGRAGKQFVSVREPATAGAAGAGFAVSWTINPNAVQGAGTLEITGYDASGKATPVYKAKSKTSVAYPIVIGGDIAIDAEPYTAVSERFGDTVFVSEFTLSCEGTKLANAQLRASVSRKGSDEQLFDVPVALSGDKAAYQVSWTLPSDVATGSYVLSFFREVDRQRAAEQADFAARQAARDGVDFDPSSIPAVDPIFAVDVSHSGPAFKLPVSTQFVAFVATGALFYLVAKKRYSAA